MTTLDRMFFVNYVRNFLIVLVCLVSLYVVVDLFMNLNDFTKSKAGLGDTLTHIGGYYAAQVALIYDRLAELVTLAAAVFTAAWMQRNNELLPLLSAGVPTRRVIRPMIAGVVLTTAIAPLNTEFYVPAVAEQLTVPRDDPELKKPTQVKGAWDTNGDHIEGASAVLPSPKAGANPAEADRGAILKFEYTSSISDGGGLTHLTAERAVYIPEGTPGERYTGGWKLYNAKPELPEPTDPAEAKQTPIRGRVFPDGPKRYFVKTDDLDFDTVVRGRSWYQYANTPDLWTLLNSGSANKQPLAVMFHQRLVRPLNGLLLAVLGLAVILKDQNRHVLISAGLCLILAVVFSGVVYGAKYLGDQNLLLSPMIAAWVPVLLFGPLAFALFDAIHT